MRNVKVIAMLPLAILGLLSLMAVDLVRMARGKQTVDQEWHDVYMNGNINHGQGRGNDNETINI